MAPSLKSTLERFEQLVDPLVGVIREVSSVPLLPGEPDFPMVAASLSQIDRLFPITGFSEEATGTALDARHARIRALGEAVERYAGFLVHPSERLYLPVRRLKGRAISPEHWPRCSASEYARNPLALPDPRRPYHWIRGWSLTAGEPVFVPAIQVALGFLPDDEAEWASLPSSTGLSAGLSLDTCTLAGLCEVLERDAFMLTWGKRLPAPELVLPAARWPDVDERVRRINRAGLRLRLHGLLPDSPPATVLALLLDQPGGMVPVACGLGCAVDPRQAVAKAIDEAVQSRWASVNAVLQGASAPSGPEEVAGLSDHLAYYLDPGRLGAFAFLAETERLPAEELQTVPAASATEAVYRLTGHLRRAGYEVIRVETTPPDIREAGFRTVRVIVPGLLPLAHGQFMRFLASPRWDSYPGEINPDPHPFG